MSYSQIKSSMIVSGGNTLRSTAQSIPLNFDFYCKVHSELVKDNSVSKITVFLDRECPSLLEVFADLIKSQDLGEELTEKRHLSFVFHNQEITTLLVSKDGLKVRFQSQDYSALQPVVSETCNRLQNKWSCNITFQDKLPIPEFFEAIDEHFALRFEIKSSLKTLEDRTYQFRQIQKRMLNRFKDKNPSPLNNLDFLLNHTYGQIIDNANIVEELRSQLT